MSFFNIEGTAELHCQKTEQKVPINILIKPVNGITRIICSPGSSYKPHQLESVALSSDSLLVTKIRIESAAGTLSSNQFYTVHINHIMSASADEPMLITQVGTSPQTPHSLNVTASHFSLNRSCIEFDFQPIKPITDHQLMFIGSAQTIKGFKCKLVIGNQSVNIQSFGQNHPTLAGIVVAQTKHKMTEDDKATLTLTLQLYLRQKIKTLSELSSGTVTINLIDHSTVSYGTLSQNCHKALMDIKSFILDKPSYRTYLRFLIELSGNSGPIDDRMLNGFVALEALFPGEALRKEKIANKTRHFEKHC